MLHKISACLYCCIILMATSCHEQAKHKKIVYAAVNDSSYRHDADYTQKFTEWKTMYENCMKSHLFRNAIYIGFQEKFHVGDITNISAQIANDKISLLDTAHLKNMYSLFSGNGTSNCYTKINMDSALQNKFYLELTKSLAQSQQYQYLNNLIDTAGITFGITTLSDNSIIPDSLLNVLQRTSDTALLEFKKILLTPGNVLLMHDAIIFGFYSEFSLKQKLSATDENKFSSEQFFNLNNPGETASIKSLPGNKLRVLINKYYTVFGEFYSFKEVEN